MRKVLLAAVAASAIATPALARNGSPYVGIEGGLLLPRDLNGNANVDYVTFPGTPVVNGGTDFFQNDAFDAELKRGWDVDVIGGYDFGAFRLEGELGWKRAKRDGFDPDGTFLNSLNAVLNRPSAAPDPGAPGSPALTQDDFDNTDGKVSIRSAMINALADFGADDGVSFYAGAGFGRAKARALNDGDSAWAWQLIAGVRSAISPNVDIGLKYRYFRTGRMNFVGGPIGFEGNVNSVVGGTQRTVAYITPELDGRFRSHSLLASLTFNFGAPRMEPVVAAPPPPPAPEPVAPATQTCADGSVILATDACPAPPVEMAPPPPPPAPERG
jgi:opacity protein-like surface antigen